ncbi:peptide-methionine (S)-S-oxide reductase, partial [Pseudomonas sp. SB113]
MTYSSGKSTLGYYRAALAGGSFLAAVLFFGGITPGSAETATIIPPPAKSAAATGLRTEKAIFAGGCFWGVQGVFQHVKGVQNAVSGYAGGQSSAAKYEIVSSGQTGHAESVEVTYDPKVVSYGKLLQVYFSVAHNPTELNRQGPDT